MVAVALPISYGLIPVPPHLRHLTILSPFLRVPFPSQFLHFCFFCPVFFRIESSKVDRSNLRAELRVACCRFRRHRVRCFDGTGGGSWRDGSLRASSSLR